MNQETNPSKEEEEEEDIMALLSPDLPTRVRQLVRKRIDDPPPPADAAAAAPATDDLRFRAAKMNPDPTPPPTTKPDPLSDMLSLLRCVAADPSGRDAGELLRWKQQVLRARHSIKVADDGSTTTGDFPYHRKKQRCNQLLQGTSSFTANLSLVKPHTKQSGGSDSQETVNLPTRRSKRTFGLLKLGERHLPRKRIPVGEFFQADIPEWTGHHIKKLGTCNSNGLDDSRWLGTRIWPVDGICSSTSQEMIGKGRSGSCTCSRPGSIECIKFHVSISRLQLKSYLGQAFFSLGFDKMGEEVSWSWTKEEQMWFDYIVIMNPMSQCKSFWEPALKHFHSKRRCDIASYYFNVFVLRRMSHQTRLELETIDSDDDESNYG